MYFISHATFYVSNFHSSVGGLTITTSMRTPEGKPSQFCDSAFVLSLSIVRSFERIEIKIEALNPIRGKGASKRRRGRQTFDFQAGARPQLSSREVLLSLRVFLWREERTSLLSFLPLCIGARSLFNPLIHAARERSSLWGPVDFSGQREFNGSARPSLCCVLRHVSTLRRSSPLVPSAQLHRFLCASSHGKKSTSARRVIPWEERMN